MRYLSRWVARGSLWPGRGGIEDRETPVPLCRCTVCKKCFRVLPVEIAPYKSYTRPVMETACAAYAATERPTATLRQTVVRLGGRHPHPSALHGWLGGLGVRALGRLDRQGMGPPVGALIVESAKGLRQDLLARWTSRLPERSGHPVSPTKYRSPQRHEQLESCARLFDVAGRLFPQTAYPWSAWENWLESRFHVTAWDFPARFRYTPIQQHGSSRPGVPYAPSNREPKRRTKGKTHGARAPP